MREIKFRAWHKVEKKMSKPFGLGEEIVRDKNDEYLGLVYEDDLIIMQYTGLKDKNGREIYEGDIVRFKDGLIAKVEFDPEFGAFVVVSEDDVVPLYRLMRLEPEVIGNIYENPELLEGKDAG